MMMSPEGYYEFVLKGKNADEIMTAIRSLKRSIARLKKIAEAPDYAITIHPSEAVRISCEKEYLERAKQALAECGGVYVPTKAEIRTKKFNDNIPNIKKLTFEIGEFGSDFHKREIVFYENIAHCINIDGFDDEKAYKVDKEEILEMLSLFDIGDWDNYYSPERYGCSVLDGTSWSLRIEYSNGLRPVVKSGDNLYPYNFDRLLSLLNVERNIS